MPQPAGAAEEVLLARSVPAVADVRHLDDLVTWVPRQRGDARCIHERLMKFPFLLDREPVKALRGTLLPGRRPEDLTPLSAWIVACQFVQTRGLVVLDSPVGLVACLPVGLAQVSSVAITAREGVTLRKGEELGHFQFGGSAVAMLFERASNASLVARPGIHRRRARQVGFRPIDSPGRPG